MKLVSTGVRQRSNFGTRRRWQGFLIRALAYSMIIYGSALVMLLLIENSILYPAPKFPSGDWDQTIIEFEDASFTADDETQLHGWFVPHSRPRGTLLYFHGNAENVSYLAPLLRQLNEEYSLQVLAFDYRGYGKSEGTPFEKGLHRDSRAALKWLNERTKTKPSDVIFYARSLGGGVAIDLAAEKGCKALVLENIFIHDRCCLIALSLVAGEMVYAQSLSVGTAHQKLHTALAANAWHGRSHSPAVEW
jgi:pimeloyl-ACP methyl ester carboxylesterase